jgi:hypothetical protein
MGRQLRKQQRIEEDKIRMKNIKRKIRKTGRVSLIQKAIPVGLLD